MRQLGNTSSSKLKSRNKLVYQDSSKTYASNTNTVSKRTNDIISNRMLQYITPFNETYDIEAAPLVIKQTSLGRL